MHHCALLSQVEGQNKRGGVIQKVQTNLSLWEDLFENKASYQTYNNKLEAIRAGYLDAAKNANAAWQFLATTA